MYRICAKATSCFWQLVAGPSPCLTIKLVHVGFVADKGAMEQIFPNFFCFSQYHFISAQYSFIHHRHYIILVTEGIIIWKHLTERSCIKENSYDFLGPPDLYLIISMEKSPSMRS
jgi:hypothetical protein